MDYLLPALSAVCAVGALAVGVLVLVSVNGFKRGVHARLEGLERLAAQVTARPPSDEPLVQAVSELARIGQRNHEALLSVLRDERAYLEPRLQHIYAYLEQMLAGISHIYKSTQDESGANNNEQLLEPLRVMLSLLTAMNDKMNALGSASGDEREGLYGRFSSLESGLIGVTEQLAALIASNNALSDSIEPLFDKNTSTVISEPGAEDADGFTDAVIGRMDDIAARLEALQAGLEARKPPINEIPEAKTACDQSDTIEQRLIEASHTLDDLAEGVNDLRARLSAQPDTPSDAVEATLAALRDELEQRDTMLFERLEALRGAARASGNASALQAFAEEFDRYNDVLSSSRRKLKRITRAIDEAGRRTRAIQRKLCPETLINGDALHSVQDDAED